MEGFQGRKFFARELTGFPARPALRGGHWFSSGISDKISSSRVVNILHDKTFRLFGSHFAGGAKRRPVRFERRILSARRAVARLAVSQNEVRRLRFLNSVSSCFAPKRIFAIMEMYPTNRLLILMAVLVNLSNRVGYN